LGGFGGEGRLAIGRRVAGGGGPVGLAAPPPAYKAAPQSSFLRTENELFFLWKSSRFYRPGGTFSVSSALCISETAALRTSLSSANGGRGEAWANVCKLSNELGRVVVRRFQGNASVGQVRKCASIYCGLSEPARVLPIPLYKARGGPHVCPLFAFRNQPVATPRAASELHSRDDPDFTGIPTTNILRTGLHARIKYIPVGWPRSGFAQGLHRQTNGLRDGPDFQRIPSTNILRTCVHARINSIQNRERRSARPSN